jgi:hypothetical protein
MSQDVILGILTSSSNATNPVTGVLGSVPLGPISEAALHTQTLFSPDPTEPR